MKTINANSKGSDFIKDLNDNFAECSSVGIDGTISVSVPLQGGDLKTATGYVDGRWCEPVTITIGGSIPSFTYTDDDYNKYLHTPCYLSLRGNKVKSDPTLPSGVTQTIFCYDDSFTLMSGGVVNAVANIPVGTAYVKFQLYNSSGFSQVIALGLTLAAQPQWVKNTFTPLSPQFANYEVKPPKLWDTNYTAVHSLPTGDSADVDNTRYHDNCFVMLPPNYDPQGEPCKFVIVFAGDGTPWFMAHDVVHGRSSNKWAVSGYKDNFDLLNNCGYAVVSLCGYTSMWSEDYGATRYGFWSPRISPAFIASVRGLHDYLMRNYNFDPAPYLIAKSAGGSMMLHTAASLPFPVRAAAGLSVNISTADSMSQSMQVTQKSWQKRCGCANWNSFLLNPRDDYASVSACARVAPNGNSDQQNDAGLMLANAGIYRQLDQFTLMSDMDYTSYLNAVWSFNPFTDAQPPLALTELVANSHKNMRVPLKLWCATADPATPHSWHQLFVDWVNRCNGIAVLRSYTGGGHATFDNWMNGGVTASYNTPYGGQMTAGLGFVEAVEWFKRW